MIKDISAVKIGSVWNSGSGATYKDEIETEVSFPDSASQDSLTLASPIRASLLLIRMKEGVSVILSDVKTSIKQTCSRCMETFEFEVNIPKMEAHFYEHLKTKNHDKTEEFPIRRRDMSIDLTEAIRQEIILHFPLIPVCSKRCKGLCSECRVNLNNQKHVNSCSRPVLKSSDNNEDTENRPFANLKDYFTK